MQFKNNISCQSRLQHLHRYSFIRLNRVFQPTTTAAIFRNRTTTRHHHHLLQTDCEPHVETYAIATITVNLPSSPLVHHRFVIFFLFHYSFSLMFIELVCVCDFDVLAQKEENNFCACGKRRKQFLFIFICFAIRVGRWQICSYFRFEQSEKEYTCVWEKSLRLFIVYANLLCFHVILF